MKLIIAIIQPHRLEAIKAALTDVEVFRLTVLDCQGFGRQKGHVEVYRGHEFSVNLVRKVQLQIAVNEEFVSWTTTIAGGDDRALSAIAAGVDPHWQVRSLGENRWRVERGDTAADELEEVTLTKFSGGVAFGFER